MFLKLLIFVFLLGSPATASVKSLLNKLGSQFSHTVSETTKSIKDITKTMSDTINGFQNSEYIDRMGQTIPHKTEANLNQAEGSKRNLNDADWRQLIDVRIAKSDEDEHKTLTENQDTLDVSNPMKILQDDVENPNSYGDGKKQSQPSQLTDETSGDFVPNLNPRHIFDDEQSAQSMDAFKSPFLVSISSKTPIEVKGAPYLGIGASRIAGHISSTQIPPLTADELIFQQNNHKTIKYSREHSSSSGTFQRESSAVHKSNIPQVIEMHQPAISNHNQGDISMGASGVNRQNGLPIKPTVGASSGGYLSFVKSIPEYPSSTGTLKASTDADKSLFQQNVYQGIQHSSSLGLFKHHSSIAHDLNISQGPKVHYLTTGIRGAGPASQQHQLHSWEAAGVNRENGYPIKPTVGASSGGYLSFVKSIPEYPSSTGILKALTDADKSLLQQNVHQGIQHSSSLGLFKHHSSTAHDLNIPQGSELHNPSTGIRGQGHASQQHQLQGWEVAGIDRQTLCSYGHPVVEPIFYASGQGHSNVAASALLKPHSSRDMIANDLGYNAVAVPGLIILQKQFTPINVPWDRMLLLKRHHIPLAVYNPYQGFGAAEHQELLHNRGSFPESDVSSTELPSTIIHTSTEGSGGEGVKEGVSVTVSTVIEPTSGDIDDGAVGELSNKHKEDKQNRDVIAVPRNNATDPDIIIFRGDQ